MGNIFGGGGQRAQAQMPEIKPPTIMPDPDKEAQKNEEFRKLSRARSRATTRANTILGDDSDGTTLG
jgi:hypothetical protein